MIFTKLINKILGRKEGTHPLDFTKTTAVVESKPANDHVEATVPKSKKPRAPRKPKTETK
jgi:hypothetical protein